MFLGGLAPNITEADLLERFKPFGTVNELQVSPDPFGTLFDGPLISTPSSQIDSSRNNRGYAHFSLKTSAVQWQKLVSAYNGSSWRGSRLCIEEARPDFSHSLAAPLAFVESSPRRFRPLVRHGKNMSLVTDAAVAGESRRKGWKRSRFGRAVAVMTMRRPDGKMITIDPDHHKENIQKLFGSVKPRPIAKLTWSISVGNDHRDNTVTSSSDSEDEDFQHPRMDLDLSKSNLASLSAKDFPVNSEVENSTSGQLLESPCASNKDSVVRLSEERVFPEQDLESTGASSIGVCGDSSEKAEPSCLIPENLSLVNTTVSGKSTRKGRDSERAPEPVSTFPVRKMEDTGFSLGRLLGLEPVSLPQPVTASKRDICLPTPSTVTPMAPVSYADFLFDMAQLETMSAADYAFCRRCGREEYVALWKEKRYDLRISFKQRIRQAKRLVQSRPVTRAATRG